MQVVRLFTPLAALCLFAAALTFPAIVRADVVAGRSGEPGASNNVSRFGPAQNGDVAPLDTLGGPATTLSNASALHYDAPARELWVSDFDGRKVAVFDVDAQGDASPRRSFTSGGMGQPRSARIMANRQEVAVITSLCCITFYPYSASGSATPLRSIGWGGGGGSQTQLNNPAGFDYSPSRDLLYVGDYLFANQIATGRVMRFARTASAQAAPVSILEGTLTQLGSYVPAIAIHEAAEEMYVLTPDVARGGNASAVLVFGIDDSGDVAPRRKIAGVNTGLENAVALALDLERGELVVSSGAFNATPSLRVFPLSASGNVAPSRAISGPNTGVTGAAGWYGVAVVPARVNLFRSGFEPQ